MSEYTFYYRNTYQRIDRVPKDLNILKHFHILYIEDDRFLLQHTSDVLEDFVGKIFAVTDTAEAIKVLESERIDAIISDILLENENGIDFLELLRRERGIHIPTVLTTAHTDTQYLLDAIKLKVDGYIVKPIDVKELLNTLYDILLPLLREQELRRKNIIIKMISAITDSKQVEVVRYIADRMSADYVVNTSYSEIMEHVAISKPTLIKIFKELGEKGILQKAAHKTYKLDPAALDEDIIASF